MKKYLIVLATSMLLLSAITRCSSGETTQPPAPTETATAKPEAPSTPKPTEIPEHRILVSGDGFINRETGEAFVPGGVNHINITRNGDCALAANIFDPAEIDAMFAQLAGYGNNTVRMFLDTCKDPVNGLGAGSGGLNPDVLDNIVDLMRRTHATRVSFRHPLHQSGDSFQPRMDHLARDRGFWLAGGIKDTENKGGVRTHAAFIFGFLSFDGKIAMSKRI